MAKRVRIPAKNLRDYNIPDEDTRPSPHGSQVENAVINLALPDWSREASPEAGAAFLPSMICSNGRLRSDGNSRGSGPSFDGHRPNPDRSCGGDWLGMKAPARRSPTKGEEKRGEDGSFPSSVELFSGPALSCAGFLEDVRRNRRNGKAFPLAICHVDGMNGNSKAERIANPVLVEWCIRDYGDVVTKIINGEDWDLWCGIPIKPVNDRVRGRGGSPASVWVVFERRHPAENGFDYWYEKIDASDLGRPGWNCYATLNTSVSERSGARFIAGEPEDFAADVDAATSLR